MDQRCAVRANQPFPRPAIKLPFSRKFTAEPRRPQRGTQRELTVCSYLSGSLSDLCVSAVKFSLHLRYSLRAGAYSKREVIFFASLAALEATLAAEDGSLLTELRPLTEAAAVVIARIYRQVSPTEMRNKRNLS